MNVWLSIAFDITGCYNINIRIIKHKLNIRVRFAGDAPRARPKEPNSQVPGRYSCGGA